MGNRLTKGDSGQVTQYQYNAGNELALLTPPSGAPTRRPVTTPPATCLWKALAERLTTYAWDGENRLTSVAAVSGTETYAYCADGLREKKVTASGTTYYLRDGENVLNELNASLVATARYVGYPGKWGGLVSERVPGVSKFYALDFQGNARALLSAAGAITDSYLYRAFGEEVAVKRGDCQPVPRVRGVGLLPGQRVETVRVGPAPEGGPGKMGE